ncbi:unnamed protein product [Auanema sp. JU1783]|nr:unnamed protein product [Auanema sp. JU1783]
MPFYTPLPGGANDGSELVISGTLTAGSNNGFVIEYQSNEGVALHFNVRMGFLVGSERAIVLNNNRGGRWQSEQRQMNMLVPNQYISMSIQTSYDKYNITINGSYLCSFFHRESPSNVHTLQIRGDIRLDRVQLTNFADSKQTIIVQQQQPTVVVAAPVIRPPPTTVVVAAPAPQPTVVIAPPPRPAPTIVIAPRPRAPLVEVVIPRNRHHHHRH